MSEMGGSYDPGPWKGFNFQSARKVHSVDNTAGRGYGSSVGRSARSAARSVNIDDHVPASVSTDSKYPLVIACDGTGSMGNFPNTIFKKLPFLDRHGVDDYLPDAQISYCMIGDAGSDRYPLQVQDFCRGTDMQDALNNLIIEGNGGGNAKESYDLALLYYLRNCEMPSAIKPVFIMICDEGLYPTVDPTWAEKYAKVNIEKGMLTSTLFEELSQKFSVYCIRKRYGEVKGDKLDGTEAVIQKQWEELVGADRIAILNDPNRVVDVILGLLAYETGKEEEFTKELEWRQTKGQVQTVKRSLVTIGKAPKRTAAQKSIMKRDDDSKGIKRSTLLI